MSLIAEYHAVLRRLVEVADKAIPAPEGGLSNFQLNEAEEAISAAHKLLNCTCDEGGSAGCPVHDAAVSKDSTTTFMFRIYRVVREDTVLTIDATSLDEAKAKAELEATCVPPEKWDAYDVDYSSEPLVEHDFDPAPKYDGF